MVSLTAITLTNANYLQIASSSTINITNVSEIIRVRVVLNSARIIFRMRQLKTSQTSLLFLLAFSCKMEAKVTDIEYAQMPPLFQLDDYENCMILKEKALYCTVVFQLAPEDIRNTSTVWNTIQNISGDPSKYRHDLLRHGICIPKSCPSIDIGTTDKELLKDGLSSCYTFKYNDLGLKASATEVHCETDQPYYPIDNYDITVGIVFGIIIWIVIVASFYEGTARYKPAKEYDRITNTRVGRILTCFSLPQNWSRLRAEATGAHSDSYKSVNGTRFFNTQLVIMAHVGMICYASPVSNPAYIENLTRRPENMLFLNGSCAIQTFLLITGYLISFNFLLIFEKRKQFQLRYLILAFINRYIRLTPCLLLMIAFNSTWLYHFSRGPLWDRLVGNEYRNCRKNWWVNLLYLNNYYDVENMCMQHTWYLATDTQLFLMALVVVAFMWKYQNRILLILSINVAMGLLLPGIMNYYNNFDIVVRQYPESFYHLFLNVPEWRAMYSSSLPNVGGYALGMMFGYIAYKKAKTQKKMFTNKIHVAIWWVMVWGLPLGVIYYGLLIYQDDYQHTRIGAAVYVALQKNLFALGICMLVYGSSEGIGWFLRDCVCWPPLQVLGRLTYCTFLVHVAVIRVRGGQATSPSHISNYWIFTQTVGDAVVSYIFGTLLALFVELPVSALQKLMVPQVSNREAVQSNTPQADDGDGAKKTTKKIKNIKK